MADYKPPLVISVHGIRTPATWQKRLAELLFPIRTRAYDYGYYGLRRFLSKRSNDEKVNEFYEFYCQVLKEEKGAVDTSDFKKRPSVIAHSLGAYIVANAMLRYDTVKFDKVIFCGSILPKDFDLSVLFRRDQVGMVRNEFGAKDFWPGIVDKFVPNTGSTGRDGFNFRSKRFEQRKFDHYKHSDYFKGDHICEFWIPFLKRKPYSLLSFHGKNVTDKKRFSKLLDHSHGCIDEPCFSHLPGWREQTIPRGLSLSWIDIEPDIYEFLKDRTDHSVVGYINAMPVKDEAFEQICRGELMDNQITQEHIAAFESKKKHKVYLMSMAIKPEYRERDLGLISRAFETLLNGFIDKLIGYAQEHGITVNEIAAVGWTPEGRGLCEALKMPKTDVTDKFDHPIYRLDIAKRIEDEIPAAHSLKELLRVYRAISQDR